MSERWQRKRAIQSKHTKWSAGNFRTTPHTPHGKQSRATAARAIWSCLDDWEKEMRCPICLCMTQDMRSLPCAHVFCGSCLRRHATTLGVGSSGTRHCAICKSEYKRRTVVHDPAIELLASSYERLCDLIGPQPKRRIFDGAVNKEKSTESPTTVALKQGFSVPKPPRRRPRCAVRKTLGPANPARPGAIAKRRGSRPKSAVLETQIEVFNEPSSQEAATADEVRSPCTICRRSHSFTDDRLVECSGCGMMAHQVCYGIPDAAIQNGHPWMCARCERFPLKNEDGYDKSFVCCLCPNRDDVALKPALSQYNLETSWVHVSCAYWHTGPQFGKPETLDQIYGTEKVDPARRKLVCTVCKKSGACLQCSFGRCAVAYHAPCGFQSGIRFELRQRRNGSDVYFHSFCKQHRDQSASVVSDNSERAGRLGRKRGAAPAGDTAGSGRAAKRQRDTEREGSRAPGDCVIVATGLGPEEKSIIERARDQFGLVVVECARASAVTHVVTSATRANGLVVPKRTMKYLQGLMGGVCVVGIGWLKDSVARGKLLVERPYAVRGDNFGCGAAVHRHYRGSLFSGLTIVLLGEFRAPVEDLVWLVRKGGGRPLVRLPDDKQEAATPHKSTLIVVYEPDVSGGMIDRDRERCVELGAHVVLVSWLFDSISKMMLQAAGGGT